MKSKPFLSILIPVYNVENYIRQCLDSILSCSFYDYEIIIIIGTSTDNSNSICKEYKEKYQEKIPDIIIIYQNGKGLSNARNCGLSIARGEYIMFVDSDDYINSSLFDQTIQQFYSLGNKCYDILVSDFSYINQDEKLCASRKQIQSSEAIIEVPKLEKSQHLKKFLSRRGNYWNVWRYLYRRDFLLQHNFQFKENYKSEDIDYSTRVLLNLSSCCFYHNPYYCYRVRRQGSLANEISMQNVNNLLEILENSMNEITAAKVFPYKKLIKNKLIMEYIYSFLLIKDIFPEYQTIAFHYIRSKKKLLKETFSGYILYLIISFVGIRTIADLLFLIRKYRRKLIFKMRGIFENSSKRR